jgi:redox-sensitive bicupin YhaK (pirin superfamily)
MSNSFVVKSKTRGYADHGWLKSYHSFSFASYYHTDRMHFGALRVLNDDFVIGGEGFGTHPHSNMEIISIALEGDLEHKDSMGNGTVIKKGDVQIMSAGTGIQHSEFNASAIEPVKFLQIWIIPKVPNTAPSYQQISLNGTDRKNKIQQIVTPIPCDNKLSINQDAWLALSDLEAEKDIKYELKSKENGVYIFVLRGSLSIEQKLLESRDAIGIWNTQTIQIKANNNSEILIIEVPMRL